MPYDFIPRHEALDGKEWRYILPARDQKIKEVWQYCHYVEIYAAILQAYEMLPIFQLVHRFEDKPPIKGRGDSSLFRIRLPTLFDIEVKVPFSILLSVFTGAGCLPARNKDGPLLSPDHICKDTYIPRGMPMPHFVTTLALGHQELFLKASSRHPFSSKGRQNQYEMLQTWAKEYWLKNKCPKQTDTDNICMYPYQFPLELPRLPLRTEFLSTGFTQLDDAERIPHTIFE